MHLMIVKTTVKVVKTWLNADNAVHLSSPFDAYRYDSFTAGNKEKMSEKMSLNNLKSRVFTDLSFIVLYPSTSTLQDTVQLFNAYKRGLGI